MAILTGKRIVVGVTGGIASYKTASLVSSLAKGGAEVKVVLTSTAQQFVTPLTFATVSRNPAYTDADLWQAGQGKALHTSLGEWAEMIVIAPLSANTLGKIVHGLADNLLLNLLLASACPVVVAPAMNTHMWDNPAVQKNWEQLSGDQRFHVVPPTEGLLACNTLGVGKMAEPADILPLIESVLWTGGKRDLLGKKVLVSAGGTREFIDGVRFIGNPATGKQGIALALSAHHRGAEVTLILANGIAPPLIPTVTVTSSDEMHRAMVDHFDSADIIVMNAAVGDVKPQQHTTAKLPKQELPAVLPLVPIPDILQELSDRKAPHQLLIGFAAQTGSPKDFLPIVRHKLTTKHLDMIVANQVNVPDTGFASDYNQVLFLENDREELTPLCSKLEIGHRFWDFLLSS